MEISVIKWIAEVKTVAYGYLKLKPWEFEMLSIIDFEDMYEAYAQAHERELWEQAYWVSNMISVHTKHGVTAEQIMKPFIKEKSAQQKGLEAERFFVEFKKQQDLAKKGEINGK